MLTAKNGKVVGTFISPLYDLQTEPKENASGPSRAYPGHRLHIDSIDDKKTVVKANKNAHTNIPGGPGQNFRQEIYAGQISLPLRRNLKPRASGVFGFCGNIKFVSNKKEPHSRAFKHFAAGLRYK